MEQGIGSGFVTIPQTGTRHAGAMDEESCSS
jgi:hypothetical protein